MDPSFDTLFKMHQRIQKRKKSILFCPLKLLGLLEFSFFCNQTGFPRVLMDIIRYQTGLMIGVIESLMRKRIILIVQVMLEYI